ncbi:TIGR01621 family pseudouridine synthase [Vibrio hannami]|uniref:TIGR01621 family pseudouridine synthase n=1 Tax=Vibrio hannami TaxID=2717094 RepID=UPI00240F40DC|nr:TIGR01621 family pseudouridine synthase [Vibrio hannami]MDG3088344.1 TIGR01621 family pseudouridine synthase [Vibrio hannami]
MFDIIYSHPDFIIINKHPNISVHKDDGETMLIEEVAKATNDEKLYLVHRLDKMTSGLLILARSHQAASSLSQLFAERKIEKFYLAIGSKKPKKKQGLISGDMEKSRRSAWKLANTKNNPATTQFFSQAGSPGERLFLCKPRTGKTHQIRVALKSIGSPICGDPIYNPSDKADRGYLHAYALRFCYLEEPFSIVCNPADYSVFGEKWSNENVKSAMSNWQSPWTLDWPSI